MMFIMPIASGKFFLFYTPGLSDKWSLRQYIMKILWTSKMSRHFFSSQCSISAPKMDQLELFLWCFPLWWTTFVVFQEILAIFFFSKKRCFIIKVVNCFSCTGSGSMFHWIVSYASQLRNFNMFIFDNALARICNSSIFCELQKIPVIFSN